MSKLTINGVEIELDLLDADVMDKYEKLNKKLSTDIKERSQYEGLSNSDAIRLQCRYINKIFDDLFGPGTSETLFAGRYHLGEHLEAYGVVANAAKQANDEAIAITEKYSFERAASNREQRRANIVHYNNHPKHKNGRRYNK